MATAFTFKFEGFTELQQALKSNSKLLNDQVRFEIEESGQVIVGQAKVNVVKDTGRLASSIVLEKVPDINGVRVEAGGTNVTYAPYIEFGTGKLVQVPQGLESYAMQFKGKGIKEVNLPARPFMFPAFFAEKPKLIKKIKNVLDKLFTK